MDPRARNAVVSLLVAALVAALYAAGFAWAVWESSKPCGETGVLSCTEPFFGFLLLGTPTAYVVWSAALQALRVPLPWLAPLAVCGGVWGLLWLTSLVEVFVPFPVALVAGAALAAAWGLVPRLGRRRLQPQAATRP